MNKSDLMTYYNVGKMLSKAGKHYGKGIIKEYSIKLSNELRKKYSSGTYTGIAGLDIEEVADSEGYIYLEPGESLFFVASNTWYSHFDTDEYNYANGNYQKFNFTFNLNFEQATE